ncbi:MAG: DNA-processing protein DprA [Zoogloeaceae bacterium]|jgi:DNA processing protein|nr:DNA-processing protein DprA [Zoogloeaceae bacterium]
MASRSPETEDATGLSDWLRLTLIPGIGGESQRKLLAAFGLPQHVFAAGHLAQRQIIASKADLLTEAHNAALDEKIAATLAWAEKPDCHIITLADKRYPPQLLEIPDPPTLLYVRGNPATLSCPGIAVVGSRNATPQGCKIAEDFARTLADAGFVIISGLALGIDAAAHNGALTSRTRQAENTIAVIGTGADRLYPARNQALAQRIVECGAIVSEFPLGTPAIAANFPRRNRVISGLARGVLVVEAATESGSLITARLAGEQGREVFAIPGSIHSPFSRGCHRLIRQGAKLVESAQDILEELTGAYPTPPAPEPEPPSPTSAPDAAASDEESRVLAQLGHDLCTLDELALRTALPADTLLALLLNLELEGQIATLPGNRYQRIYGYGKK